MKSAANTGMIKVDARVPTTLKNQIEEQAESEQLSPSEWIRSKLAEAILADQSNGAGKSTDQLVEFVHARFDRLEQRLFDENNVILKLGFEILLDLARVKATTMATNFALNDLASDQEEERRNHLAEEGMTSYLARKDDLFPVLKTMRDEAKTRAKASTSPPGGSNGSS